MEVDPRDFRLWVAMHEETHRVQFTAVPWLRDHMVETTRELSLELAPTPSELAERLQQFVTRLPDVFSPGSTGLAEVFLTPAQKAKVDEVTAVMSLIEGHAEVVMDDVGPAVIPSVAHDPREFTRRRQECASSTGSCGASSGSRPDASVCRNGAVLCGVVDSVGLAGFDAVWTSPETLPSAAEMAEPAIWVSRVHG